MKGSNADAATTDAGGACPRDAKHRGHAKSSALPAGALCPLLWLPAGPERRAIRAKADMAGHARQHADRGPLHAAHEYRLRKVREHRGGQEKERAPCRAMPALPS